ncbi:transcriptional regulator [Paenibacillus macquariensis subsp. defensor]|nr:transcriptional regulator [Paenibacillus macquariensis subsp. defensor]
MKRVDLNEIKRHRKDKGHSLEYMAKLLGYESLNGYYYLEIGRGKFTAEALAKVADEFKVPIESLFFDDGIAILAINEQSATTERKEVI